jgi:rod shape-determining protein MreC
LSFRDRSNFDMKVPLTWTAGVAVIIAAVIGVALLLGDRRETLQVQAYGVTKNVVDTLSAPVSNTLATPGRWTGNVFDLARDYLLAGSQNHQLRVEISDLHVWQDKAIAMENENQRLRAVLGLKTDPPIPMVTAHVIADSRGPFADTRVADAGRGQGITPGNPVMSERGLVGRVVGVGHDVSRILLLTDIASRTPVLIDRTNARAILSGDGGPNPKLAYMRGQDPVKVGDRVLTSGDGGVFPRGLPVGVAVQGLDGAWRVRLDSDSSPIDFVRILLFRDFSQIAEQKDALASTLPPLSATDAAEVAAKVKALSAVAPPTPAAAPKISAGAAAANASATAKTLANALAASKKQPAPKHLAPPSPATTPPPDDATQ